jgi:hypothetical protein
LVTAIIELDEANLLNKVVASFADIDLHLETVSDSRWADSLRESPS